MEIFRIESWLERVPGIRTYLLWREKVLRTFRRGPIIAQIETPRKKTGVGKLLYQWIRYCLLRYFTLFGRIFLPCMLFSSTLDIAFSLPASLFAAGMWAYFIIGIVWGWFFRPQLHLYRTLPSLAVRGKPIIVEYIITNPRKWPVWDLLLDALPFSIGERYHPEPITIKCIPPGEKCYTKGEITFSRRGHFFLPPVFAASSFPFGLWQWGCLGKEWSEIYIYPPYTPLKQLNFPLGFEEGKGCWLLATSQEKGFDFHTCREYRTGDDRRHIHAASWARLGFPVIKEFKEEYLPHAAVMIDPCIVPFYQHSSFSFQSLRFIMSRQKQEQHLEALLIMLCAVSEKLLEDGYQMDLLVCGSNPLFYQNLKGVTQLELVLRLAAQIVLSPQQVSWDLPPEFITRVELFQNLLFLTGSWGKDQQKLLINFQENLVRMKVLWIHFEPPPTEIYSCCEEVVILNPLDILNGKVQHL